MKQKTARFLALEVINAVDQEGAYSNIALHRILEKHNPEKRDRGFITELVYGILRRLNTLDWIAAQFVSRPLDSLKPAIRNILRLGIYQLFFMDRVPVSAAVNESVNLAKVFDHQGTVKFVNGVLRNIVRGKDKISWPDKDGDPVSYLSINYSHPEWMVKLWLEEFGFEATEQLCRANNETPSNSVRTNTLKITREELVDLLAEEGVQSREGAFVPEALHISGFHSIAGIKAHREGLFLVQDESSMMVGHVLSPEQGSKVIDACSAPGGKTTHLAQLMGNEGKIVSVEVHQHKLGLITDNCRRLGITIAEPLLADAVQIHEKYPQWADCVLVDAPCSGLGVLRRRPEVRWRKNVENIGELVKLQLAILQSGAQCLKTGGVIVYSTCTLNRAENMGVVEEFLKVNGEFVLEDLNPYLPGGTNKGMLPTAGDGFLQFLPHVHETDGFFMARMRKN